MGIMAQMKRAARWVENQEYLEQQLPLILGDWYYVVPGKGSTNRVGTTMRHAFDNVEEAYDKCGDGDGDGICLVSYGTSSADTTSYLTSAIDWAKYNITMVGIAAGGFGGRARISNISGSTDLAYLIDVQGQNNRFFNIHMANYGSNIAALGCLKVSGERNTFWGSHFRGAGHTTPANVAHVIGGDLGAHDLNMAASECYFKNCTFGDNSIVRAAENANIVLNAQMSKVTFEDCRTILHTTTATQGAIALHNINVLNGWIVFKNCTFTSWTSDDHPSVHTSMIIGANPTNCGILLQDCGMIGWAAYETGADRVFVTNTQGNATGGLGIKTA